MSEALRFNQGKKQWSMLDCYFQDAQEAELECREYGVEKYTDEELEIDGLTNWASSMGTDQHHTFMFGCLESANRHLLALRRGEHVDPESGKLHVGFVRLNMGMFQAYFNFKWPTESSDVDATDFVNISAAKVISRNITSIQVDPYEPWSPKI
tara:strand:- start:691 stop:1149 length:459 start_codon:yes stop_codon:yes gene_type:complete